MALRGTHLDGGYGFVKSTPLRTGLQNYNPGQEVQEVVAKFTDNDPTSALAQRSIHVRALLRKSPSSNAAEALA